jgi:hypothetical protein
MISKLEYIIELKKCTNLNELMIDDNPVIVLKETSEILKVLPVTLKKNYSNNNKNTQSSKNIFIKNNLNNDEGGLSIPPIIKQQNSNFSPILVNKKHLNNTHTNGFNINKISSPNKNIYNNNNNNNELQNFPKLHLNNNTNNNSIYTGNNSNQIIINNTNNQNSYINTQNNITNNNINKNDKDNYASMAINTEETNKIISQIKIEWIDEFNYIKTNGFNGYNSKRLKESKIISGHAELEEEKYLIIYGNALEVVDNEEFYDNIVSINFEYFNIDLITTRHVLEKLKKFKKLNKLSFSNNNLHSFYQLVKFEDLTSIDHISVIDNEINKANLLKYFLIYRFQNLKYFNEAEISTKDINLAKKFFEYFDKCISQTEKSSIAMNGNGENVELEEKNISLSKKKIEYFDKADIFNKEKFFNFVKDNLNNILEELIDED